MKQIISSAFSTIDHGVFLRRLAELGIGGSKLWWVSSLANRSQKVVPGCPLDMWGATGFCPPCLICMKPMGKIKGLDLDVTNMHLTPNSISPFHQILGRLLKFWNTAWRWVGTGCGLASEN